jgi:hypothetical protein
MKFIDIYLNFDKLLEHIWYFHLISKKGRNSGKIQSR